MRFLRWEFVPEAVLAIGLTAFLVHQNDAATSAFKSSKALVIMAAVTVAWLAARVALARLVRFALVRAAVFSVAAVVALSVVVFPAYDNETVIESFPTAAVAPAPEPVAAPTPTPSTTATPTTATTARRATTTTSSTRVAPAAAPSTTTSTTTTAPIQTEAAPVQPVSAPAPMAGPQRLRAGAIRGIDHRASGTAVIYRQPDGRYVVGLEDIDIQPGPDYDLYVVPGSDRKDTKGGVRLGDLRGNRGTQFYEVPASVNLEDGPWTVLVWCQTFAVPVAGSTPA
jgi:hypothetical protein